MKEENKEQPSATHYVRILSRTDAAELSNVIEGNLQLIGVEFESRDLSKGGKVYRIR